MVGPSLEGHAIVPLVLGGRHELVEGAATEGLFLLEFPSYGEAVAWYQSPAYLTVEPGNAAAESMDNVSRSSPGFSSRRAKTHKLAAI
jgi:uncharacterized protein (DUF1330 family)